MSPGRAPRVVGLDGAGRFWVAVVLEGGRFAGAFRCRTVAEALARCPDAATVGVDMPIGLPARGPRAADVEARRLLGPRRSSVFPAPPRAVLLAATHARASAVARGLTGRGVSRQAYALRERILEVEQLVATGEPRLIEVHPEVSFRHLAGAPLAASKHAWAGLWRRRALLGAAGVALPVDLGEAGLAGADDVLDAAVVALTADRYARGSARSVPDPPERGDGERPVAIWY